MTSKLISHVSMTNTLYKPYDRLSFALEKYTDTEHPLEQQFIKLVNALAQTPPDSPARERLLSRILSFLYQNLFLKYLNKDQYESSHEEFLNDILAKVPSELGNFNPTGVSLIGCLNKWLKEKLRLKYAEIDIIRKHGQDQKNMPTVSLSETASSGNDNGTIDKTWEKFLESPTLSGLEKVIQEEQQFERDKNLKLGWWLALEVNKSLLNSFNTSPESQLEMYINGDPDGYLRGMYVPEYPDCNYQFLAQELILKQPPSTKREISKRFGIDENALHAYLNRHFYPKMRCLRLEKNLLTPDTIEVCKARIETDNTELTSKVYKKAFPNLTVKFMAVRLLPMFCKPPMSFEDILKEPDLSSYKKLTVADLEEFWSEKCFPRLGKLIEQELVY